MIKVRKYLLIWIVLPP